MRFESVEHNGLPGITDSNSPAFWRDGLFHIFTSAGSPMLSIGASQFGPMQTFPVKVDRMAHFPMWIESVWQHRDGTLYAWYHFERIGVCPGSRLSVPAIGALVSRDGGRSFRDLGIILSSGEPPNCSAQNGFFAGGHGDFSVVPDRNGQYFYFYFGAYGGDSENQGIATARMAVEDLSRPVGNVWKYHRGAWREPGLRGRVTPIFKAAVRWEHSNKDSFWGPSVHWNTHLNQYVMLFSRSCCEPGWPQEGIYISLLADPSEPDWSKPQKLIGSGAWYPQVLGLQPGETDSESGQVARLYAWGESDLELHFFSSDEMENPTEENAASVRPAGSARSPRRVPQR